MKVANSIVLATGGQHHKQLFAYHSNINIDFVQTQLCPWFRTNMLGLYLELEATKCSLSELSA